VKRKSFVAASAAGAMVATGAVEGRAMAIAALDPKSAITDVAGLKVGHYTETRRPTGCTVVLVEEGAVGGVDVRGSAPGTRETDLLNPENLVERVNAVVLSGGSAYGLDAATGVMRYCEERGIGFDVRIAKVPIVPAAVLFDLPIGNDPKIHPTAEHGYAAAAAATASPPAQGNAGAGTGATVGKMFGADRGMKGGIGTASATVGGLTVGAIVAVNAVGDVIDPATGKVVAGARTLDGKKIMAGGATAAIMRGEIPAIVKPGTATTIGVIATDAVLTKAQAQKIAQMAHDGYARAINPSHTMFDGDTIFTIATGKLGKTGNPTLLGMMAAEVMAAAILRAVLAAQSIPGWPAARDLR
jgi:L-aminopeptidase/D-esterase-like protein